MDNYLNNHETIDDIPDDELFCDVCGMTYLEFLQTGQFGCENCYRVFKNRTVNVIKKKIQDEIAQNNSNPVPTPIANGSKEKVKEDIEEKIEELKKLLLLCKELGEEDKALVIEKEIKKLEQEEIEK